MPATDMDMNQEHLQEVHHQRNYGNKDWFHNNRRISTRIIMRRRSLGTYRYIHLNHLTLLFFSQSKYNILIKNKTQKKTINKRRIGHDHEKIHERFALNET